MEGLIRDHIAEASTRGHTAPMIAEAPTPPGAPVQLASLSNSRRRHPRPAHALRRRPNRGGRRGFRARDGARRRQVGACRQACPRRRRASGRKARAGRRRRRHAGPARLGQGHRSGGQERLGRRRPRRRCAPKRRLSLRETAPAATDKGGWIIQVGISADADKANDLLARARAQNRGSLAQARPFTEKVAKGEDVFYRARFAGLDSAAAETACRSLKKSGFACFAARD